MADSTINEAVDACPLLIALVNKWRRWNITARKRPYADSSAEVSEIAINATVHINKLLAFVDEHMTGKGWVGEDSEWAEMGSAMSDWMDRMNTNEGREHDPFDDKMLAAVDEEIATIAHIASGLKRSRRMGRQAPEIPLIIPRDLLADFTLDEFRQLHDACERGFEDACVFLKTFKDEVVECGNGRLEWAPTFLRSYLDEVNRHRESLFSILWPMFPDGRNRFRAFDKLMMHVSDGGIDMAGHIHQSAHAAAITTMTIVRTLESFCDNRYEATAKWREHPSLFPRGDGDKFNQQINQARIRLGTEAVRVESAFAEIQRHGSALEVARTKQTCSLNAKMILEKCKAYHQEREAFQAAYFRMQANPENYDQDGYLWTYEMRQISHKLEQIAVLICAFGKQAGVQVDEIENAQLDLYSNYHWPGEGFTQIRRIEFVAKIQVAANHAGETQPDTIADGAGPLASNAKPRISKQETDAKAMEKWCRDHGDIFPGVSALATDLKRAKSSLKAALDGKYASPYLKARKAEYDQKTTSKARKVPLTLAIKENAISKRESSPDRKAGMKADKLVARLIDEATPDQWAILQSMKPEDRDRLNAMTLQEQEQLIETLRENPDAGFSFARSERRSKAVH